MGAASQDSWVLLRVGVLRVGEPPQDVRLGLSLAGVDVHAAGMFPSSAGPHGVLTLGIKHLTGWAPDDGGVQIPAQHRVEVERTMEVASRLAALDRGTKHSLASANPCLGLVPPRRELLDRFDGVEVDIQSKAVPLVGGGSTGIFDDGLLPMLADRLDGVAMLSEALNSQPDVGRFTQLWRLFERAFKAGHRDALSPMVEFLASSPHNLRQDEVERWAELRNPAVHANRSGRLVLNSDVFMLLGRMREAAHDVLFNKELWCSRSAERRDVWRAASGSTSSKGDFFVTQGQGAHLELVLPDPFGAFPSVFFGPIHRVLPEALWLDSSLDGSFMRRGGSGTLESALERSSPLR